MQPISSLIDSVYYFKQILLLAMVMFGPVIFAQNFSQGDLERLEDEELLSLFNKVDSDSVRAEMVARTYLNRARREGDTIKMARGYDRLARIFHPEKNIAFADSIIRLTKNSTSLTYPTLGYIIKGYQFEKIDQLQNAIDNYILAYDLAFLKGNVTHQVYISDVIIFHKSLWGNKQEALTLQRIRHSQVISDDYKNDLLNSTRKNSGLNIDSIHSREKIISLQNYTFCFLNLRQLDSSRYYLNKSFELMDKIMFRRDEDLFNWSLEILMELNFHDHKYDEAVVVADSLLARHFHLDQHTLGNTYMFKGLSLIENEKKNEGLSLLKYADTVLNKVKHTRVIPEHRTMYNQLFRTYASKNDYSLAISYLERLMLIDSLISLKYQVFEPKLAKKFTSSDLIREKEIMIDALEMDNLKFRYRNFGVLASLGVCFMLLLYYFHKQRLYRKRFHSLLDSNNHKNDIKLKKNRKSSPISNEIINTILSDLNKFERKRLFLNNEISLIDLAKSFKTNSNYLSRVINLKMGKNFSQYLHDLRIDYATNQLLEDSKFRKYTIKAIAEECGYSNAESFSKAFYKKTGIYPSYYIKKLEQRANQR